MRELALHLLDLGENSIAGGASTLEIQVLNSAALDLVRFVVTDDGRGMQPAFVKRLTDPFTTTRTERKVGLGIPLLAQTAESTGGSIRIQSQPDRGTKVEVDFCRSHLDLAPMGDLAATVVSLCVAKPDLALHFSYETDLGAFEWESKQVAKQVEPLSLAHPQIANFLLAYLREQIARLEASGNK